MLRVCSKQDACNVSPQSVCSYVKQSRSSCDLLLREIVTQQPIRDMKEPENVTEDIKKDIFKPSACRLDAHTTITRNMIGS